ncbi:hypothetical protein J437_LFUL011857 [Ladona fulva]|uniref:C2H2-type domain-containing protein n=1 Tax=Ladona fulva TaxID=123851 RepID=A0A8K0KHK2_LADFU|nr:hypothetical protein J437_LFUL011857 [Ladona fulva]
MTADTEQQLSTASRNTKCFICNARVGSSVRSSYNFFHSDTVTTSSQKQVYFCIASILECELLEESVHSQVICKKCYRTINEIDDLECRAAELKNEICHKYQQTSQNRGDDVLETAKETSVSAEGYDDKNDEDYLGKKVQKVRKKAPPKKFKYVNPLSKKKELIQKKSEAFQESSPEQYSTENEQLDADDKDNLELKLAELCGEESELPKAEENAVEKAEIKEEDMEKEAGETSISTDCNVISKEGDFFKCVPCDLKLTTASAVQNHLRRMHGVRAFVCILCGQEFDRKKDLSLHMAEDHGETPNLDGGVKKEDDTVLYLCEFCPEAVSSMKELRDHKKEVHGKARHKCEVCGKFYGSRNLLLEHMNVHNGVRPYKCELCEKTFASRYCLKVHVKIHDARPRPHACQECGKTFLCLQHLQQHARTHSENKDFVCETCGKAFATARNLEVHMVVHSGAKPFTCSVCQKGFARKAELVDHERTHTGEKPFQCETCGATFSQRSNLISHRRATHLDDRRFTCDECGRGFKRRRLLDYHRKAAHTGERPYTCETCGASFVYPEHYKKHIRVHTGERPYPCEVCGKRFGSRDNRNAHRFVHSDKKPYECVVCGMGFMRKPLLYGHMQSQGHLQDAIVINQPRITSAFEERQNNGVEGDGESNGGESSNQEQRIPTRVVKRVAFEVSDKGTLPKVNILEAEEVDLEKAMDGTPEEHVYTISTKDHIILRPADDREHRLQAGEEEVEHLIIEGPVHFSEEAEITTLQGVASASEARYQSMVVDGGSLGEKGARVVTLCSSNAVATASPLAAVQTTLAAASGLSQEHLSPTVVVRQNEQPVHLVQIRIPSGDDTGRGWINLVNQQ